MRSLLTNPVVWLVFFVVGLLLRPISSASLWIELSRGAAVLDGNLRPSQHLLVNEQAADADWLAGVPFAVAYSLLDVHGLMLLKLFGGALTALIVWTLAKDSSMVRRSVVVALGMLASLGGWDVTTQFADILGLVVLCWMLHKHNSKPWPSLMLLGIWSQFGSLAVIGLVIWVLSRCIEDQTSVSGDSSLRLKRSLPDLLLAVAVCSMNPRGALALWDSLRLAVPRISYNRTTLLDTEWRSLLGVRWDVSHWSFAVLTCLALSWLCPARTWISVLLGQTTSVPRPSGSGQRGPLPDGRGMVQSEVLANVATLLAIGLGWSCQAHVGFAGIWLSHILLGRERDTHTGASAQRLSCGFVMIPLMIVAWWPWEGRRPGWGLDSRLDERLLSQVLSKVEMKGTVWADDELSAGMLLWETNQQMKVHDTPRRALLGGRLREFVSLRRDLEQGRLAAYQREDNSTGGWWLPLRERQTDLLMVSAERGRLLRALEPTIWKPLALDSGVLPFGQSGAPEVSPLILEILRQRDLVEKDTWSSSLLGPAGTDRLWDFWGFFRVSPNTEQELRQAHVFRALQLPRAARRVLEPALRVSQSQALQLEAASCQRDLAFDPVAQSRSEVIAMDVVSPEISRCTTCHADQVADFARTGHHNALKPLDRKLTQELLAPTTSSSPTEVIGVKLWSEPISGQFVSSTSQTVDGIPSQWLFGSGKHARTPVSVWLNADGSAEALEHRLSWYPHHGWGATLGLNQATPSNSKPTDSSGIDRRAAMESLGKIHDPAATRDCFGCHTTKSPLTGDPRIAQGQSIIPGVSCERCHPGSDQHARLAERGSISKPRASWHSLTPLESVNRCGECHRRADHFTPDELNPDNQMLIRFASVGLVQSACFRKQATLSEHLLPADSSSRFDCMTCHDPHRPAETETAFFTARCAACHETAAKKCSQQPLDSNCLPCHMPKVEVQSPLRFTDHWIRIRKTP